MENKDKEKKFITCYDLEINENDSTEVNWVSLVHNPAIQLDWVAFSQNGKAEKTEQIKFKMANPEKRILAGVFMKAGKPIIRVDEYEDGTQGEEYAVMFSKENIETAVKKFQRNGYGRNSDTEHNTQQNGCYILDSWYIRDPESNPLKQFGFAVEEGDWVGTIHVPDEKMWNEYIKTGALKGFSVMGLFKFGKKTEIEYNFSKQEIQEFSSDELDLISKIADLLLDEEKKDNNKNG